MNRIIRTALTFIHTQLVVTLFTLPLLVHWGLSCSIMTFVGNLIFIPFLLVFMTLCALLFFMALCGVCNTPVPFFLEYTVILWDRVLSLGSKHWLYHGVHPGLLVLISMPTITLFMLIKTRRQSLYIKVLSLVITGVMLLGIFHLIGTFTSSHKSGIHLEKIIIKKNSDGTLSITDKGFFSQHQSSDKMVEFDLKPFLAKHYGSLVIKKLHLIRTGCRNLLAVRTLCQLMPVQTIILDGHYSQLTKNGLEELALLEQCCYQQGTILLNKLT